MIGKLVSSALAGSNVGRAIGPILKLAEHIEDAVEAGIDAPKGILQNMVDWISGGGTPATAGTIAGGGRIPLSSGIPFFHPPDVGGVLFDKAAEVLTDLEEITGAYWDDKLGQVVLVGKKNGKMEELFLPRMDKDHLAVAMRAVFSGDNLGVSIDPPPGYLESGKFPADGTKMLVRYLGNTKDTLFGAIILEADRLLKTLSMGRDNITHDEVTSQVQGFQNELDLSLTMGTEKPNTWHRMWFVIEDMRLDLPVKESTDRNSIKFGKAAIKVKAEYISQENNPGVDPVADRFAKHFTLHFDDFAKEFPILERLRELAKISAIVKWLRNSGKPIDLSFLNDYDIIKVPTPGKTPGITASKSKSWQGGNTTHTQTYSLYGGVDFDFKYQSVKDDGEAIALKKVSKENKPCGTALEWDFNFKGMPQKALALPMVRRNGNYTTIDTDASFTSAGGLRLEVARCYDSFNAKPSIFGYGWNLRIPFEIFIINPEKADSPVLLIDRITSTSYKYLFVEDKQSYFLVREEKDVGGTTSFTYDPQKFIKKNTDNSFTYKSEDSLTYNFDPKGRLNSITDRNSKSLDYIRDENRVVKISDSLGKIIRLIYDYKSRVKQVICPGQKVINYQYDPSGDLIRVSDNEGNAKSYAYDVYHHLMKATDARGKVILRNNYDPLGRIIRKKQEVITNMKGNLITKNYDDICRLIKEEDKVGNTVSYEYDKENNLSKTILTDRQKRTAVFEHDKDERVKRIINPMGHAIEFRYDSFGYLTSFIDANKNSVTFKYDEDGNLIAIKDAMGNQWRQEFDNLSRLTGIIDPLGNKVEFTYMDNNRVSSIITAEGRVQYEYDEKGRLRRVVDPNGNPTEYVYDSKSNLAGVRDALGLITKYQGGLTFDKRGKRL